MSTESVSTETSKRNAFFHNTVNITAWMRERLLDILNKKGYSPVSVDVRAEIMTRMSKMAVINSISVQYKDKHDEMFELINYSSISKNYDGPKNTRWLVDALKEVEGEAMLKFGSHALKTQPDQEYTPKTPPSVIDVVENKDTFAVSYLFHTTLEELRTFITDQSFIARWTLGQGKLSDRGVYFENTQLSNIEATGSKITMQFQRDGWAEATTVLISLTQIAENVKLVLRHKDVPLDSVDALKRFWCERVFSIISQMFNCPIKSQ